MSRKLSNRIEAIEYVHAQDGLPYRHDFKSGGTISLQKDGSVRIRNRSKRLWDVFDVNGDQQPFLVNPPAGRTSPRGGAMAKRRMSALQRKYFGKRKSNPRRRRRTVSAPAPRRRRRRNPPNPPARRRRRRNPSGFSINGILGRVQRGAVDAACVVAGKAIVRYAASFTNYADGSMMDSAVETLAAIGAGLVAEKVLGSDHARFVLAGGLASPLETMINQANIPVISPLLGAYPNANTAAIYASADSPRMGSWQGGGGALGSWQGGAGNLAARRSLQQLPPSTALMQS